MEASRTFEVTCIILYASIPQVDGRIYFKPLTEVKGGMNFVPYTCVTPFPSSLAIYITYLYTEEMNNPLLLNRPFSPFIDHRAILTEFRSLNTVVVVIREMRLSI